MTRRRHKKYSYKSWNDILTDCTQFSLAKNRSNTQYIDMGGMQIRQTKQYHHGSMFLTNAALDLMVKTCQNSEKRGKGRRKSRIER